MKITGILFLAALLTLASCTTRRWGVYTIQETYELDDKTEARILTYEDETIFRIESEGRPIAEMSFWSNEIKAVMSPYRVTDKRQPDNLTATCDGTAITTVRWITQGTNTIILFDRDNDGFPETRSTHNSNGLVLETITPIFELQSREEKHVEPVGRIPPLGQEEHNDSATDE